MVGVRFTLILDLNDIRLKLMLLLKLFRGSTFKFPLSELTVAAK